MNNQLRTPVILITGASTGLGLSIAKLLLDKNYHLVLTARTTSLERFKTQNIFENSKCWIRALDILNPLEREAVIGEINEKLGGIDILINNAGFAYRSVLEHVKETEALLQLITNFEGPLELIRLSLPAMRSRRSGKIINISSVGGMMAMPTMGMYSASKFALEGASEALFYEVKPWNISVTLIEPGFINSESFKNTRYTTLSGCAMRDPSEAYYGHYHFMGAFIAKMMRLTPASSEQVAKKVLKVINSKSPPLRVAGTPDALFFDLLRRILPRNFYHWLLYNLLPHAACWGDENRLRKRCRLELERIE